MASQYAPVDTEYSDTARIESEARDWILRRDEPSFAEGWAGWCAADPRHAEAYRHAEIVWEALGRTAQARQAEWRTARPSMQRRFAVPAAIAASLVAAIAIGVTVQSWNPSGPRVATQTAQVRTLDLQDGSRVVVGAKSTVDLRMSEDSRQVILKDGEAFFEVAHDPKRPFTVVTDDAVIRVLGTKFDVRQTSFGTQVSVLEGRVEVRRKKLLPNLIPSSQPAPADKVLGAGELVRIDRGAAPAQATVAPVEAGSWRGGRLLYNDALLREVVADANRYSDHPIQLEGDIGDLRVTVSFRSDAVGDLVANLDQALPIRAERRPDGAIIFSPDR